MSAKSCIWHLTIKILNNSDIALRLPIQNIFIGGGGKRMYHFRADINRIRNLKKIIKQINLNNNMIKTITINIQKIFTMILFPRNIKIKIQRKTKIKQSLRMRNVNKTGSFRYRATNKSMEIHGSLKKKLIENNLYINHVQ